MTFSLTGTRYIWIMVQDTTYWSIFLQTISWSTRTRQQTRWPVMPAACLRNRRWGKCVYVLQMFFLLFFVFFRPSKKTDNRSRERLNGFPRNFYQTIGGKWSFQCHTEIGARPPNNFLRAKNYTLCTWWWRLASDSELVCWLVAMVLCSYGGCVEKAWRRECI